MTNSDILSLLERAHRDAELLGFDVYLYGDGAGLVIDYTPRPGYLEIVRPIRRAERARDGMMQ